MELGREFVRERVRKLLGDTSDSDVMTGTHGDYPVTFSYSSPNLEPPETHITVELPTDHGFELRIKRREHTARDTLTIHGFSGTTTSVHAARFLVDRPTARQLLEQRVSDVRIATFDVKTCLPRSTVRLIEQSPEGELHYRAKHQVTVTVRGWIEDAERAVATIALVVDLASRVSDAVTRAAGAELKTGPYRDAPTETASGPREEHRRLRRLVSSTYALLSRALVGWWPF
jgi:hypothetical protein